MKAAFLPDRGVIKVSGEDARRFLDGLVTTNLDLVQPGIGRFGALLTPQGKIIADFLVTEAHAAHGGGFVFDCPLAQAQPLADRLGFYKLRAKVSVENLSSQLGVLAAWGGEPATSRTSRSLILAVQKSGGASLSRMILQTRLRRQLGQNS